VLRNTLRTVLPTGVRRGVAALLLGLIFYGALNSSLAQQAMPALPFLSGEELIYQAEFNKGLLRGVDVAEFQFQVDT
jgi:hypothetical protein